MRRAGVAGAGVLLALVGGCGGEGGGKQPVRSAADIPAERVTATIDWRAVATKADRERLREWRGAWLAALAQARAGGAGTTLVADPALYALDAALPDPLPPAGEYRCRTIKLGAKGTGGLRFVAYPFFRCRVSVRDGGVSLEKLTGSQRGVGIIYPHDQSRAVFLGTMALGDERGAVRYGRDASRDMAGWVERIAPSRWRIALPYPAFESTLDLLDLVPA